MTVEKEIHRRARSAGTVLHACKAAGSLARQLIAGTGKILTSRSNGDEAHENAVDVVESTIYQQAIGGNTLAAIFYLKAHRQIYRDRVNIDVNQWKSEIEERMAQLGITPQLLARAIPALTVSDPHAGNSIFHRVKLRGARSTRVQNNKVALTFCCQQE